MGIFATLQNQAKENLHKKFQKACETMTPTEALNSSAVINASNMTLPEQISNIMLLMESLSEEELSAIRLDFEKSNHPILCDGNIHCFN